MPGGGGGLRNAYVGPVCRRLIFGPEASPGDITGGGLRLLFNGFPFVFPDGPLVVHRTVSLGVLAYCRGKKGYSKEDQEGAEDMVRPGLQKIPEKTVKVLKTKEIRVSRFRVCGL